MTISNTLYQRNEGNVRAFCRSPILMKLCSEHGELVAESVRYLESNTVRDNPAEIRRRLAMVRMIVEMASWLNAARAVGSGHRSTLNEYRHDYVVPKSDCGDPVLVSLEYRSNCLGERIARIDGDIRSRGESGRAGGDVISQLADLMCAAGSGCFSAPYRT